MGKYSSYLRCPYCGKKGEHSKKVSKSVGSFRIIKMYDNFLILQCAKCSRVCAIRTQGNTLMWEDMSQEQKQAHKDKLYVNYNQEKCDTV